MNAAAADLAFEQVNKDVLDIDHVLESSGSFINVNLVRYIVVLINDRKELIAKSRFTHGDSYELKRAEHNAEQEIYNILGKSPVQYQKIPKQITLSYRKFLKVLYAHVGFMHQYAGFQTLDSFITRRRQLFSHLKNHIERSMISQALRVEIIQKIGEIDDLYVALHNDLRNLNNNFVLFSKTLNQAYDSIINLEGLRPFRTVKKPGFFGRLFGKKPEVTFNLSKAANYLKKFHITLSAKDHKSIDEIKTTMQRIHRKTVKDIVQDKELAKDVLIEIGNAEDSLRKSIAKIR